MDTVPWKGWIELTEAGYGGTSGSLDWSNEWLHPPAMVYFVVQCLRYRASVLVMSLHDQNKALCNTNYAQCLLQFWINFDLQMFVYDFLGPVFVSMLTFCDGTCMFLVSWGCNFRGEPEHLTNLRVALEKEEAGANFWAMVIIMSWSQKVWFVHKMNCIIIQLKKWNVLVTFARVGSLVRTCQIIQIIRVAPTHYGWMVATRGVF